MWLSLVKRYGRFLALCPLILATVTFPRLYFELIGMNAFGTREILKAEVIAVSESSDSDSCTLVLQIGSHQSREGIACGDVAAFEVGDVVDRVFAWTTFNSLEDNTMHAVMDFTLALTEIALFILLLRIHVFVDWIERQTQVSVPHFKGNSQRKEMI